MRLGSQGFQSIVVTMATSEASSIGSRWLEALAPEVPREAPAAGGTAIRPIGETMRLFLARPCAVDL
jgi:hypothetical protein